MNTASLNCKSEYVTMRDGIRLAVTTWLAEDKEKNIDKRPAIMITTRYWRAMKLQPDRPELQSSYPSASYYLSQGYVLVIVDARGSGASFGCRETEISSAEVEDIGELINWVSQQNWCDGRVATSGTSYTANTALYSLMTAPPALKLCVCRAPDFDGHRHLLAPGGIINHWFIKTWSQVTAAQDSNNVRALFEGGYWPPAVAEVDKVLGVRPVDKDMDNSLPYQAEDSLLAAAIAEHKKNFNLSEISEKLTFVDNNSLGDYKYLFEPSCQKKIEKCNIPIVIRCGWHDAGTALGALSMFVSFNCLIRIILGPWSHGGDFIANPFIPGSENCPESIPMNSVWDLTAKSLDTVFKQDMNANDKVISEEFGIVEYYTLGENRWKTTKIWPPTEAQMQRLYLAADHKLNTTPPISPEGSDQYQVDPTAGTGLNNRWHTQMGNPIFFPDRQENDKKLLIYDTPPLESDIEITGHPVVCLLIRSTATDGQFFAYLETIEPTGQVRMITEGQLRGLHRKVSDASPPYHMFGPYHSLKEKDALLLKPGEVFEITFDLFPISILLKKGQRIRLSIAGADKDVFAPIIGCESPKIIIERNNIYTSYIDLPVVHNL